MNYMRILRKFENFGLFKNFFFIWQNAVRKLQKSESEVFKVNPRFLKIPEGPKMDWKSLNYFPGLAGKKLAGITKETLS